MFTIHRALSSPEAGGRDLKATQSYPGGLGMTVSWSGFQVHHLDIYAHIATNKMLGVLCGFCRIKLTD